MCRTLLLKGGLGMTFEEFKADLLVFLQEATVNLGRRNTKSRARFLQIIVEKLDAYGCDASGKDLIAEICDDKSVEKKKPNSMSSSVLRIKPTDPRRALDAGKGVHAMNASESGRADEQLCRSPFANKTDTGESANE